jgi:membrane protein YdbS with pleckstrin-like domain
LFCHRCGAQLAEAADGRAAERPAAAVTPREMLLTTAEGRGEAAAADDAEQPVWEGGYSPRAMAGPALAALVGTILAGGAAFYWNASGAAWGVLSVVILIGWLGLYLVLLYRQWSVRYQMTTQRLMHQTGILRRITDRVEAIDIDDITVRQGLVERLLGVGTIVISSSDRTHPELQLRGIADAKHVASTMDDVRRLERRKRGVHIESI